MSTTAISFSATLIIGDQLVPLLSEVVTGDKESQSGVENGFLFKLNRESSDPPVAIYLGDIINFIEKKLNGGDLSQSPDMALISKAFPSLNASNFNSSNQAIVNLYEFSINSTTSEFLFSINLDIEGADPSTGLIELPGVLAKWLRIDSLSIAFRATRTKAQTATPTEHS